MLKPYFVAKKTSDNVLGVDIYGEIGDSWFGDSITAKSVKSSIDEMGGSISSIQMRINSPGGDAFEGIAIANLLKSYNAPIKVSIDGLAASAASVLAMCGDDIEISKNAMLMIHNASAMAYGEAGDLREKADILDKVSGVIAQTYADKTGLPLADIQSMMDAETWMTSDEAKQKGFVHSIVSADSRAANLVRSFKSLASYKNVPADLLKEQPSEPAHIEPYWNVYEAELKRRGILQS